MIFLRQFNLLTESDEYNMICYKMNIHNNIYPLKIFPEKGLKSICFDNITILYGGNGTGKTTLLKIIGNTLGASRKNINNDGIFFNDYISRCRDNYEFYHKSECKTIKYISSDDVFDYLLDLRAIDNDVNRRKDELIKEYHEYKELPAILFSAGLGINQYNELKNKVDANKMTVSRYVRERLGNNNVNHGSNGETALEFWENEINDYSLYIIDEPENSLSAENQLKLQKYIEDSARFYNCQFIIATHSPFFLAMNDAKIYDLDSEPVIPKKWTELKNVQVYNNFFKEHRSEFE